MAGEKAGEGSSGVGRSGALTSPAKSLRAARAPAKAAVQGGGGKMTVTQDELEEVREAFQLFDSEGTGFLDASELKARSLTSSSRAEIGNCYRYFLCSGAFGCTVYVCELC